MVAIVKKSTVKPKATKVTGEQAEFTSLIGKSSEVVAVKVKIGGEFGVWGIELFHSKSIESNVDPDKAMDELIEKLDAKCMAYAEAKIEALGSISQEIENGNGEEAGEGGEGGEEVELTESTVLTMSKKDLVALIDEFGIDVDPKQHKSLGKLRNAVAAELFPDDGGEGGEGGEEEGITEETIREMDREEITNLISEYGLEIEVKGKKLGALIDEVLEALSENEESGEGGEGGEEEPTEELVRGMDREELATIIAEYGLEVDPKQFKKLGLLQEAVVEALFVDDDGTSEFENTDFSDEK